jgi:c-di-GMP-binding flagellar brake protein YcgR
MKYPLHIVTGAPGVGILTENAMSKEKRHHDRFDVDVKVEIRTNDGKVVGTVRDLSISGLFVYSEELIPVDTDCTIKITMNTGAQEMHMEGQTQVARLGKDEQSGEQGMGFRFVEGG